MNDEQELQKLITLLADDLLEMKAIVDTLIDINECNTTTCIILEITCSLIRKVFYKNNKCKLLLGFI